MKLKTFVSIIITLLIIAAVGIYLIALDNRYKQIYGRDYFDIRTGKTVKGDSSGTGEVIVEYPLLKTQYKVEADSDPVVSK
jgi:hypothetical protein